MMDWEAYFERYLECSYKYYVTFEETYCTDARFDLMCKELLECWDEWEHKYKHLIDKDLLRCGSGFSIQWPQELKDLYNAN